MTTSTVLITGNTYPVKDQIKDLGGRWDAIEKGWRVPESAAQKARSLVESAPKSSPRASSGHGRNWDPNRFNGHGRPRGGHVKACISGGNCSSLGSGKSCGGHDCDGY